MGRKPFSDKYGNSLSIERLALPYESFQNLSPPKDENDIDPHYVAVAAVSVQASSPVGVNVVPSNAAMSYKADKRTASE